MYLELQDRTAMFSVTTARWNTQQDITSHYSAPIKNERVVSFTENETTQSSANVYSLADNKSFVVGEVLANARPEISVFLFLQLAS